MEEITKIRNREEIPAQDKWAIEDLYPTDEAWEQELATLSADQEALTAFAGRLGESGQTLFDYLRCMEEFQAKSELLGNYCMRKADEDTRDPTYQAMSGKYMNLVISISAACSFDTPEIMAIPDETLDRFYRECPQLERYRRFLTDLRRRKAHILSPQEEKLLAAAGEMSQSPDAIFGAFADADLKFPDAVDTQGGRHPLTMGTYVTLEESPDRVLRKSAYENIYDTYGSFRNTTAAMLNAQNKQLQFFADARKYDSALDASLDASNVPTAVYHNLIDAVHQNLDKLHRYVSLRKRLLGLEDLRFYDMLIPVLPGFDKKYSFAEAKQIVYDALKPLGEDYRSVLKQGMDNGWVDVYQNVGKRGGAYSAGTAVHPLVLMNYTGNLDSVLTLAHEMGHAMHSYLSYKNQNFIDANYVLFVAEVASTCNESLMMRYLLDKTTDKKERAYLINQYLDQFKGTLYRQAMFAEFERTLGQMTKEGRTLTADALCAEYKRLNEVYYGPDLVVDDRSAMEWARIPHFYYDYYVYQYATGFSAAVALSSRILKEGEPAVKDYLNFLSGGCSKSPIDLLKGAGVDMTGPEPVNEALKLFGQLLDELEELT
ncbi:MAG: oligoendopeptidase F [Faecousia sp.]